jgi:hypothetical protein
LHASAKIKIALLAIGPTVARREVHAIDVVYPTWDSLAPENAKILASQQRPWMHSTASPVGLDEGISMTFLLSRLPFHKRPIMKPLHLPAFFMFAQPTLISTPDSGKQARIRHKTLTIKRQLFQVFIHFGVFTLIQQPVI